MGVARLELTTVPL